MKLTPYKTIFSFLVFLGLFFSFGNVSLAVVQIGTSCRNDTSICGDTLLCSNISYTCVQKPIDNSTATTGNNASAPTTQTTNNNTSAPTTQTKKSSEINFTPQIPFGDIKGKMNINGGSIGLYITEIYKYAVGVVGILASIVIMWGGVRWLTAGGNGDAVSDAKKWIEGALSGLVLVMISYMVLYFVNPDLTSFKLITITPIKGVTSETASAQEVATYNTSGGGTYIPPNNVDSYDTILRETASKYGVSYKLLKAIMLTESAGKPNTQSGVGAVGLMQVMPKTATPYLKGRNLNDPAVNIDIGAQYLRDMSNNACNGKNNYGNCNVSDPNYVIASYNGGPGSNRSSERCPGQTWWQCNQNSGYQQTREYVARVNTNLKRINDNNW